MIRHNGAGIDAELLRLVVRATWLATLAQQALKRVPGRSSKAGRLVGSAPLAPGVRGGAGANAHEDEGWPGFGEGAGAARARSLSGRRCTNNQHLAQRGAALR